ncbi:hypothetical protein SPI_00428 [Niveomyces insectorum RCEF 264]|uniref:Cell wall beta-glucan synthesis n=1 Tax=Niveomyces insectorum RCEF 264 TaxID=1081102 RepID=A0A168A4F7_9HYPO|nr:hypothetical protein SPI_00428 [Niveomyces insectorum RCEF 264]
MACTTRRPGRGHATASSPFALLMATTVLLLGLALPARGDDTGDTSDTSNGLVPATFSTAFTDVVEGQMLATSWSYIDPKYEPLSITARAVNRTSKNHANSFSVKLTTRLQNTSSWAWPTVPYPLPYLANGLYELEIRPAVWNLTAEPGTLNVPVLARSPYFTIQSAAASANGTAVDSSSSSSSGAAATGNDDKPGQLVPSNDTRPTGPNRVALAVGLSIGLAAALGATVVLICLRIRNRRQGLRL